MQNWWFNKKYKEYKAYVCISWQGQRGNNHLLTLITSFYKTKDFSDILFLIIFLTNSKNILVIS